MNFHDDEIDNKLLNKLGLISSTPPRSVEKANRGREVFMNKSRDLQSQRPIVLAAENPIKGFLNTLFGKQKSFAPLAIALMIAIGIIFGGWGTVYAAQDSLPYEFLYPVKLAAEDLRLTFTPDTEDKVALLTNFTEDRINEAEILVSEGQLVPESLPTRINEQFDELFTLTASLDQELMEVALIGVRRLLRPRDQIQGRTNSMDGVPEGKDPQLTRLVAMLNERQELVQMGLGEPNTFQQQFRHQIGKPTPLATSTVTSTITSTLTSTPEISVTLTITTGHYGPGPCEDPGNCTPPGPFPFGTPIPGEQTGPGPGSDQGVGPNQPTLTPMNTPNSGGTKNQNGKNP